MEARVSLGLDSSQRSLVQLGRTLQAGGYEFVCPTPETYRRVNRRPGNATASTLRDVFGWSRPFSRALLPSALFALCSEAGVLVHAAERDLWTSTVRFSTLMPPAARGPLGFFHSAFPTNGVDDVFFGPDSYRFAALLARTVVSPVARLVDVGCGTGVGGLVLADRAKEVVLTDVNPRALALAAVNVQLAREAGMAPIAASAGFVFGVSDVLAQVEGEIDLLIANPPYLADDPGRLYRDGGGQLGGDLSVRIVVESLPRLAPGGRVILYTGTAIVEGRNLLAERLDPVLRQHGASGSWEELDPDVFGEELDRPAYATTERLAVVALVATAPPGL